MSVKSTVARMRSLSLTGRTPVRNVCTSSMSASVSPVQIKWSSPGNSTNFAPGIRSAM